MLEFWMLLVAAIWYVACVTFMQLRKLEHKDFMATLKGGDDATEKGKKPKSNLGQY